MAKKAVDAMLDGIRAEWEGLQKDYLFTYGLYFQGIQTHDVIPTLEAKAPPDKSKKPHDQPHDWNDFGLTLPGNMPGSIALHVYEGPGGWGYTLEARTKEGLTLWSKVEAYGPEPWHAHGWREIGEA